MERDWCLTMTEDDRLQEIIDMLNATVPDLSIADHYNVVDLIEELISLYNDAQDTITNIRDLT
jgi:hypothetical protein